MPPLTTQFTQRIPKAVESKLQFAPTTVIGNVVVGGSCCRKFGLSMAMYHNHGLPVAGGSNFTIGDRVLWLDATLATCADSASGTKEFLTDTFPLTCFNPPTSPTYLHVYEWAELSGCSRGELVMEVRRASDHVVLARYRNNHHEIRSGLNTIMLLEHVNCDVSCPRMARNWPGVLIGALSTSAVPGRCISDTINAFDADREMTMVTAGDGTATGVPANDLTYVFQRTAPGITLATGRSFAAGTTITGPTPSGPVTLPLDTFNVVGTVTGPGISGSAPVDADITILEGEGNGSATAVFCQKTLVGGNYRHDIAAGALNNYRADIVADVTGYGIITLLDVAVSNGTLTGTYRWEVPASPMPDACGPLIYSKISETISATTSGYNFVSSSTNLLPSDITVTPSGTAWPFF
jgi:hypothetical protein